jgi:hypothetical protein
VLLWCCAAASSAPAQPVELPRYHITASVGLNAPQVRGTVETTVVNHSAVPVSDVVLLLFPNRFAVPDAGVNDFNRPFVYPRQDFVAGWMEVPEVRVGGRPVEARAEAPAGCVLRVKLPSPLPPGAAATVGARFETSFPHRFGTFGEFDDMLTGLGGWYPTLAALRPDGAWAVDELPALADFEVELAVSPELDLLLNGQYFPRPHPLLRTAVRGVHYLTLVATPVLLREEIDAGAVRLVFFRRPPARAQRTSPGPSWLELLRLTLRDIIERRPPGVPAPAEPLVLVEVPLRLDLTAPGEGMVVLSDRSLKVLWLLRPFHEVQLAQAVYAELLRAGLARRESARDFPWVSEGLGHELARAYNGSAHAGTRSVQEWIELFNIFAIVDRFETVPKIPFVRAFFERERTPDPLREQITTYNTDLPPGHVILGKLRQLVGDAAFARLVERCLGGGAAFRDCAARESGRDLATFFAQWLQPYPDINYSVAGMQLNEPQGDVFVDEVTVRRVAAREVHEPVEVQLRSIGGEAIDLRWDGGGDMARLTARAPFRVQQAVIDPRRKLIETTRADNALPPTPQLVLDTAEVEISSTEFGVSGLVVGRGRYDYRKDLAAAAFYTNRSIGIDVGPRYHWGAQNDANSYRNNVYFFYGVQGLNKSFKEERRPQVRTSGHVNGLGIRYDFNNLIAWDNPTREVRAQLFGDWYDRALGSNFDYVDWGGSLVLTHPLSTYRTIAAGEVLNGFSEPLGSSVVPNQGLFSLGGSRSIRGIGAEEELGRNIFLMRGELRQSVYPELDLNLLDLLVLRRAQVRVFADTGQVSNSAGAVYDPAGYAVGVGVGFGAVYDFMGFFPSLAYLEVATRVDRPSKAGDVQLLFGTRQAF